MTRNNILILQSVIIVLVISSSLASYKPEECTFPFVYRGLTFNECTDINSDYLWCSKTKDYDGNSVSCNNDEIQQRLKRDNYYQLFDLLEEQEKKISDLENSNNNNSSGCMNCDKEVIAFESAIDAVVAIASDHVRKIYAIKDSFAEKKKYADAMLIKITELNSRALRTNRRRTEDIWYGTAPFCKGSCPSGQKEIARNSHGDGATCWTGSKARCRRVFFI